MKKILSIAFAALTILTAASCSKEDIVSSSNNSPVQPNVRILTASFESSATRTTIDNTLTPQWAVGDKIMLLNSSANQEIEVISGSETPESGKAIIVDNVLTIGTTLEGTLYAVYPSTATAATSASSDNIPIIIPEIQDGTFASANICVGKSSTTDNTNKDNITFKNATAVLKFTQTAGVDAVSNFQVISASGITGAATFNCASPATTGAAGKTLSVVCGTSATDIYLAVAPGTLAAGTQFVFMNKDKYLTKTTSGAKEIAINDLVSMGSISDLGISTSGSDLWVQLWDGGPLFATINVGAGSPTGYGNYYAWGETVTKTDYAWSSYFDTSDNGDTFSKYYNGGDGKTQLEAVDDAATANWGGSWRMPTIDEFSAMLAKCNYEWTTQSGINGLLVTGKNSYSSSSIFFPAAGYYNGTNIEKVGEWGSYYSSSLSSSFNDETKIFFISEDVTDMRDEYRFHGQPIRPVKDAPAPAGSTGTAKRTGDVDVNWVQLWEDGPKFAEYNVGAANNKAEDYGGYYCWGGKEDKNEFDYNEGLDELSDEDDTAYSLWGSKWRMPTSMEINGLLTKCNVKWTTENGVNGCKFTGTGNYAANSVFLPAAGSYDPDEEGIIEDGFLGNYWSSSPDDYWCVMLCISENSEMFNYGRECLFSVRAVLAEQP